MSVQVQFTSMKDFRRINKKKGPKLILNVIIILFIAVNGTGLYLGNIFYKRTFEIDTKKEIDQFEANKQYFNIKRFNSIQKEEVSVTSTKNNYKLYSTYLKNPKASKDTIILVHGVGGSRWSMLKYADMYLDRGFNVLMYDSRNHGDSGGSNITFGFNEKFDLDRWVSWLYARNKGGIIGVHGESMGAATALLHSQLNEAKKRVSFYISDCSYTDLEELFTLRLKDDYNIKNKLAAKVLIFYADKVNKLRNQFYFEEVSTIASIKDTTTPVLFIHGEKDTFVPTAMTEALYNTRISGKELYIAPNSAHVESFIRNQEEYKEKVYNFLDDCLNVEK
jgi:uncharacterized protein